MNCGGTGTVFRCDEATCVYIPSICCSEYRVYAHRLASIVASDPGSVPGCALPVPQTLD